MRASGPGLWPGPAVRPAVATLRYKTRLSAVRLEAPICAATLIAGVAITIAPERVIYVAHG